MAVFLPSQKMRLLTAVGCPKNAQPGAIYLRMKSTLSRNELG